MDDLHVMPLRVKVASILRKSILSGEYKAGDELSLTDIAGKLGVSRTPVREAFQTLEAEKLIRLRMNRGAVVLPIDAKFIEDHFDMRCLLESEACALATGHGMDVSALLAEQERLRDLFDTISSQELSEANTRLHASIWAAADNQKLTSFLDSLWNGISVGYSKSDKAHNRLSIQEHIDILNAIGGGDADGARSHMRDHISRSKENILAEFRDREDVTVQQPLKNRIK